MTLKRKKLYSWANAQEKQKRVGRRDHLKKLAGNTRNVLKWCDSLNLQFNKTAVCKGLFSGELAYRVNIPNTEAGVFDDYVELGVKHQDKFIAMGSTMRRKMSWFTNRTEKHLLNSMICQQGHI